MRRFGFGDPTGIDFPGEERGIVPTLSEFSGSTIGNLPIGQGLSVTPIQMAAAYAAIANGGILRPPRLILEEGDTPAPAPDGHRVISKQTAAQLTQMLEGVLAPGGTASEVSVPGYTLAGKTGTAEVAVDGGYSDSQYVASFVGFAPAQDPRAAGRGGCRRAPGQLLRRRGRGPRLRRDRQVRAALPRDPAGLSSHRIAAMKLRELLADTEVAEIVGDAEAEIAGLAYDSRTVEPGTLFFCVPGQRSDGHEFAERAVERGATALVVERLLDVGVTQVRVADARAAMASIAVRFWDDPTARLRVAGVTGTNGKTTTAFLIRHVLEAHGTRTGLLGTVKRIVGGVEEEVERTTPEAIDLQRTFHRMLEGGDAACAMEVSSHALALERTAGVRFAVAVFTNLTQDHLDFHADMEEYFLAKRGLVFLAGRCRARLGEKKAAPGDRGGQRRRCVWGTPGGRAAGGR